MRCSRVVTAMLLGAVCSGTIPSAHGESLASHTVMSQAVTPNAVTAQASATHTAMPRMAVSQAATAQDTQSRTYPDTVRWLTATYAVWSVRNGADLYTPGGGAPDDAFYALVIKSVMERDWGIRDRQSARAMISWLEDEGHNQALL